jgi:hypothetical protein
MKALDNGKRLEVLEWLRDPVACFPAQLDGANMSPSQLDG